MRKLFATLLFLSISISGFSQVGDPYPPMKTENLLHKFINIPEDVNGRYSLLCLASSKDAEAEMQTWFNPIYNQFINKPDAGNLFAFSYDIDVYFIPMFTGAKRPAYKKVMKKTEQSVRPEMRPYILFFEGTMKEYKSKLNMKAKGVPYFFVLDKESKIIHATSGKYTDQKMQEIINKVEPAISSQ